jgi:hypothetical protein
MERQMLDQARSDRGMLDVGLEGVLDGRGGGQSDVVDKAGHGDRLHFVCVEAEPVGQRSTDRADPLMVIGLSGPRGVQSQGKPHDRLHVALGEIGERTGAVEHQPDLVSEGGQ